LLDQILLSSITAPAPTHDDGSCRPGSSSSSANPFNSAAANPSDMYDEFELDTYFRSSQGGGGGGRKKLPVARAVLIDTEPKVISNLLDRESSRKQQQGTFSSSAAASSSSMRPSFAYDPRNAHALQSGAANNWAYGYHKGAETTARASAAAVPISRRPAASTNTIRNEGNSNDDDDDNHHHSITFIEAAINSVRRELERCDTLDIINIVHSVAGGTGSGLGSRMTEVLCHDIGISCNHSPKVMNTVVSPYENGEVIVQNYNAALTLSSLLKSDTMGIFYNSNDIYSRGCEKIFNVNRGGGRGGANTKAKAMAAGTAGQVKLSDINFAMARAMTQFFLRPSNVSSGNNNDLSSYSSVNASVRDLCPHPS
jgi:hypothetical protein